MAPVATSILAVLRLAHGSEAAVCAGYLWRRDVSSELSCWRDYDS